MKRVRARKVERRRIKKELWSMDSSRGSPPRQLIVSLPFPLLVQTSSPLSIAIFSRALSAEFPFTSNRLREVRSRTNVSRVLSVIIEPATTRNFLSQRLYRRMERWRAGFIASGPEENALNRLSNTRGFARASFTV